jgi:hypothetical protein
MPETGATGLSDRAKRIFDLNQARRKFKDVHDTAVLPNAFQKYLVATVVPAFP